MTRTTSFLGTLLSGVAGAATLTLLNEGARSRKIATPRLDIVGERAVARAMKAVGLTPPRGKKLYRLALAADLCANGLYYAFAVGRRPWMGGLLGGSLAGLATVVVAPLLGLGRSARGVRRETKMRTVGWYLAGGLASAMTNRLLASSGRAAPALA